MAAGIKALTHLIPKSSVSEPVFSHILLA